MAAEAQNQVAQAGSGAMFDGIAERYDLLNRMISLGVDQGWRRRTVSSLGKTPRDVLDLATGTGDLALLIARELPEAKVLGIDPSTAMLAVAQRKVDRARVNVHLQPGDAQALTLADHSVDAITMAFGIRNVPDRARALREMARVCRSGAKIAILELSEPEKGLLAPLARWHMHTVVPWLGGLLSGQREYRYLPNSIRAFPRPEAFCEMMTAAGIGSVNAEPLTFGVCHLYTGSVA
ncbi:MAG TPA: bifunctional demethylmenaquinone methyltransferase/2-methoxy-6-polyprenyl-1,4-benzoquinol methylase UbiE [Polyangiaceae bacterium]|jgi:demethylmenaquinone methyltransferase/2-methoxy-6-polyprenyl-1,4-benzoquinol methylase|nr:bifunctional demethylmenaquinone methyltransferase/2-methoxy-6-polyprenyl-1,4-benzoquinol methylase UbiE [Polyangiaceae bacterium]